MINQGAIHLLAAALSARLRPAKSAAGYNSALDLSIVALLHGAIVRRNFGMGLPELEARILSRKTGAEEIPELLHHSPEYGRGEFHVSAAGEREHDSELARGEPRALPFRSEGSPGHYPHQAAEGNRGLCAAVLVDDRTAGRGGEARSGAVPASTESEGRCRAAEGLSRNITEDGSHGIRVSARILVYGCDLGGAEVR